MLSTQFGVSLITISWPRPTGQPLATTIHCQHFPFERLRWYYAVTQLYYLSIIDPPSISGGAKRRSNKILRACREIRTVRGKSFERFQIIFISTLDIVDDFKKFFYKWPKKIILEFIRWEWSVVLSIVSRIFYQMQYQGISFKVMIFFAPTVCYYW